jgi:hypothetical protein
MLRLAGTPQGIHAASLLIKPSKPWSNPNSMAPSDSQLADTCSHSSTQPSTGASSSAASIACSSNAGVHDDSTLSKRQDSTAPPHKVVPSTDSSRSHSTGVSDSSSSAGFQQGTEYPAGQPQQLDQPLGSRSGLAPGSNSVEKSPDTGRPAGPSELRQFKPRRRLQRGKPARRTESHPDSYRNIPAQTGHNSSTPHAGHLLGIEASLGLTAAPTKATGLAAQLQWEVGWNWKVDGPVASVTKQLEPAGSSSRPSTLVIQQLKAAYDAKARSYTLTAGGAGWNVVLAVPTQHAGISGLVPRVWCPGCKPKLTLNLVPELAGF